MALRFAPGNFLGALLVALNLAACASTGSNREPSAQATPPAPDPSAPSHVLDVLPRSIAPELRKALAYPYEPPAPMNCETIAARIEELDAVLGPDFDDPGASASEKQGVVASLFFSGVRSAIPYFGWVRRLTGVDRREHLAALARSAGDTRRGHLKGLGASLSCVPPAAPRPPPGPGAARVDLDVGQQVRDRPGLASTWPPG